MGSSRTDFQRELHRKVSRTARGNSEVEEAAASAAGQRAWRGLGVPGVVNFPQCQELGKLWGNNAWWRNTRERCSSVEQSLGHGPEVNAHLWMFMINDVFKEVTWSEPHNTEVFCSQTYKIMQVIHINLRRDKCNEGHHESAYHPQCCHFKNNNRTICSISILSFPL